MENWNIFLGTFSEKRTHSGIIYASNGLGKTCRKTPRTRPDICLTFQSFFHAFDSQGGIPLHLSHLTRNSTPPSQWQQRLVFFILFCLSISSFAFSSSVSSCTSGPLHQVLAHPWWMRIVDARHECHPDSDAVKRNEKTFPVCIWGILVLLRNS
jgi:hypothetical protein